MDEFFVCVIVVDDYLLFVFGMLQVLLGSSMIKLFGIVVNLIDLVVMFDEQQSDVFVVDYVMLGGKFGDGLVLLLFFQCCFLVFYFVMIMMFDNLSVLCVIQKQGVSCILSKLDVILYLVGVVYVVFVGVNYLLLFIKQLFENSEIVLSMWLLMNCEIEVVWLYCVGYMVGEIVM